MLLLLVGCGRSGLQRGSVGGQVTLDGAPIDKGSVQFVPLEGTAGPTSGAAIRGGDYYVSRAKGPALGKYRVEVYVPRKTGRKVVSAMTAQRRTRRNRSPTPDSDGKAIEDSEESEVNLNPMQAGNLVDEWADAAPPQYNKESTLELDVQSGSNTFDVHMKSE